MNIFVITFFMVLTTLNSYGSDFRNTSSCKVNKCILTPTAYILPIEKYRLNIQIKNSYKNADVYLNKDKFTKQTSKKGAFERTISSRGAGIQCLKIKKQSLVKTFQFFLSAPLTLVCMGENNFCCRAIND